MLRGRALRSSAGSNRARESAALPLTRVADSPFFLAPASPGSSHTVRPAGRTSVANLTPWFLARLLSSGRRPIRQPDYHPWVQRRGKLPASPGPKSNLRRADTRTNSPTPRPCRAPREATAAKRLLERFPLGRTPIIQYDAAASSGHTQISSQIQAAGLRALAVGPVGSLGR